MFKADEAREQNYHTVQAAQTLCSIEMGILSLSAQGKNYLQVGGYYPVSVVDYVHEELLRAGYDVLVFGRDPWFVVEGYCWAKFEIEW